MAIRSALRSHITPIRLIFITMMIDMIGIGLMIPILPDLIRRFNADPAFVSVYYGFFIASYAFMQFFAAPILGALSDRFGRRPVLLVSLFGAGIDYLIMALAPSLWILFIGRVVSGITGASMTVANSYIADISTDSNRAANFGLLGAAFGIGFIIGPLLGGVFGHINPILPFLIAAAINLLNAACAYFLLPESLPAAQRRPLSAKAFDPFRPVMAVLKPTPILMLVIVYAVLNLATNIHPSNWTLYTQTKFGWSPLDVGISLAAYGLIFAISQVYLTRYAVPRIGERKALLLGLALTFGELLLFAAATDGWMMYAIMTFLCASGLALPCLQSLIAATVPSNEQGELQGSLTAIASVMAFLAPLLYTALFAHFTIIGGALYIPGAAYGTAALLALAALLLYARWNRTHPQATVPAPA
ncbi:MAG: TCR/Tet family MFS transporter [Alphaproteobacteria bacterium]|nr:TCR/Tet family MFS transporter [Alphaproteobacteria bacterium]MBU0860215.1 TCR/Tet family MFS transporter [Alphaproteobacteria bacterium]